MQAISVIKVMADDDTNGLAQLGSSNAFFVADGSPCLGLESRESALEAG